MFQFKRLAHTTASCPQLRDMRGGGFVARRFRNYNRGGVWENICCVPNR